MAQQLPVPAPLNEEPATPWLCALQAQEAVLAICSPCLVWSPLCLSAGKEALGTQERKAPNDTDKH